jgi:3-phosphoglycerate kinase
MTILGAINWEQTLVMTNLLGGVNKGTFLTFLDELIKKLTKKDVVILDNTRIHKNPEVRRRIEAVGARVL